MQLSRRELREWVQKTGGVGIVRRLALPSPTPAPVFACAAPSATRAPVGPTFRADGPKQDAPAMAWSPPANPLPSIGQVLSQPSPTYLFELAASLPPPPKVAGARARSGPLDLRATVLSHCARHSVPIGPELVERVRQRRFAELTCEERTDVQALRIYWRNAKAERHLFAPPA